MLNYEKKFKLKGHNNKDQRKYVSLYRSLTVSGETESFQALEPAGNQARKDLSLKTVHKTKCTKYEVYY